MTRTCAKLLLLLLAVAAPLSSAAASSDSQARLSQAKVMTTAAVNLHNWLHKTHMRAAAVEDSRGLFLKEDGIRAALRANEKCNTALLADYFKDPAAVWEKLSNKAIDQEKRMAIEAVNIAKDWIRGEKVSPHTLDIIASARGKRWIIGARLLEDLYQNQEKWGKVRKPFPLWEDQKTAFNAARKENPGLKPPKPLPPMRELLYVGGNWNDGNRLTFDVPAPWLHYFKNGLAGVNPKGELAQIAVIGRARAADGREYPSIAFRDDALPIYTNRFKNFLELAMELEETEVSLLPVRDFVEVTDYTARSELTSVGLENAQAFNFSDPEHRKQAITTVKEMKTVLVQALEEELAKLPDSSDKRLMQSTIKALNADQQNLVFITRQRAADEERIARQYRRASADAAAIGLFKAHLEEWEKSEEHPIPVGCPI